MATPQLVLASTSRSRRTLLERLRLPFEVVAPIYEEPPLPPGKHSMAAVETMALERARGKAESVARLRPDALVIGSDQICACEGEVFGKPETEERAVQQLRKLSGREHALVNGLVLAGSGPDGRAGTREAIVITPLRLRALSDAELRAYVAADRPLDSAGAYYIESLGIALFQSIGGEDPTAIEGLPLIALVDLLRAAGCSPLAGVVSA